MISKPLAYFLTFTTYGTWLPGDQRGFTQHVPNARGTMKRGAEPRLEEHAQAAMSHTPRMLNTDERRDIDAILRDACAYRAWPVHALEVRSNHVHLVVTSTKSPEDVMRALKARVTRLLRENGALGAEEPLWTRHGSTVYLFKQAQLERAIWYTLEAQDGERFDMPD